MPRTIVPGAISVSVAEKLDQRFSIQDHGMIPDCLKGTVGSMTSGVNVLTREDPDPLFTQDLVGKPIAIFGAGSTVYSNSGATLASGDILLTTVVSVAMGGLTLVTADNAANDVSLAQWACGTDNTSMFNAAMERLRTQGGGTLNWDQPGDYFFSTAGWTGPFGDYYIDRVDFDNCHINQGLHTKIVMGYPMGCLEVNQGVFNNFAVDADRPPICHITAPVAKGDYEILVNPAEMVDGGGNALFKRGDFILIFTGYIGTYYFGFNLPDAQICQIVFADVANSKIILAEPALKPYTQEVYPAWTGSASTPPTAGTDAPFGMINVTDLLIHNFRYTNANIDSFFFTDMFTGGQVSGLWFEGMNLKVRGTFHSFNYVRGSRGVNVRAVIDNLNSPRLPFDYSWTFAVGTSYSVLDNPDIASTGTAYLHVHEGNANCGVLGGSIGCFNANPNSFGIQPVSIRGRSYGFKLDGTRFTGWDGFSVVYIEDSCADGGTISNITISRGATNFYPTDIECFGENWRIDCPNIDPARIYQKSTNRGRFMNHHDDAQLAGLESVFGLLSAHGGIGQEGNILTTSDDLTIGSWTTGAHVTKTANSTDILDPINTHTATKAVLGSSGGTEIGYDVPTPAAGVVTGSAANAGRSFVLPLYVYSPTETQIEIQMASFGVSVDPDNNFIQRFAVSPVWRRIDMEITFGAGASDTNILLNLCYGANHIGGGATIYFWGVTLQEKSQHKPFITHTATPGTPAPYKLVMRHDPGNLKIGPIVDDGVTPVQIAGPARITGQSALDSATINGLDFSSFRGIAAGARWDGLNWKATATTALIFQILSTTIQMFANTGLTIGNTFTPTFRFSLSNAGNMDVEGTSILAGLVTLAQAAITASRPLKVNGSKEVISDLVDGSSVNDFKTGVAAGLLASTGTTGQLTAASAANIASILGVTPTELGYLSGVSSGIQAQLAGLVSQINTLQADMLSKADKGTYGVTGGGGGSVTI